MLSNFTNKLFFFFSILTFICNISIYSQNAVIDSLLIELKSARNDSNKVKLLCQLAWEESNNSSEKCKKHASEAISLSNQINYKQGIGFANNALGVFYNTIGDNQNSIIHYRKANDIWFLLKDSLRIAKSLSNIGNAFADIPIYDSALIYYNKSIDLCLRGKLMKPLSSAYLNIASLEISQNKYDNGIKYLLKCLEIKQKLNDKTGMANVYNNISVIYKEQKNYIKALEYAHQAFTIYTNLNAIEDIGFSEMSIGMINYKLKKHKEAEKYFRLALNHFENSGYKVGIATGYNNLGLIYEERKDYAKAIAYFEKGMKYSSNPIIHDTYLQAATNLISCNNSIGNSKKSKQYIDSANKHLNYGIQKNIIKSLYLGTAHYYFAVNDFKNAFLSLKKHDAIKDSLITEENNALTSEIEARFETKKKELENKELKLENIIKTKENENIVKQRNYIFAFASLILCIIIISLIFYKRIREAKIKIISQQEINTAAFLAEKTERERIAKELHDDLGQKLSVIKMQLSLNQPDVKKASSILDSAIHDVRSISHNLMPENLSKGLVVALENFAEELNYNNQNLKVHLKIDDFVKGKKFSQQQILIVYRIIQEFVNNSLKYANANNVYIDMFNSQNKLHLSLSDDGVGFNIEDALNKKGIGLKNIESRVKQLNGKLKMNSKSDQGTQFNFEFTI